MSGLYHLSRLSSGNIEWHQISSRAWRTNAYGEYLSRSFVASCGGWRNLAEGGLYWLFDVRKMRHISDIRVRKMPYTSDMKRALTRDSDLKARILERVDSTPDWVWTPTDFVDLASRAAIDKALQRLAVAKQLRRIDRGLYDRPRKNALTKRTTVPDYRAVIQAVSRRDNARVLLDGMTAANDLGLTTAVPGRIEVLVDARLKPIRLGNQLIQFKTASPSRLFWAGRPAMRVVQALYWLQDMLSKEQERHRVVDGLQKVLADSKHGQSIREDLRGGLSALPIWMQGFIRELFEERDHGDKKGGT
jgi:hypothetical protein